MIQAFVEERIIESNKLTPPSTKFGSMKRKMLEIDYLSYQRNKNKIKNLILNWVTLHDLETSYDIDFIF